MRPNIPQFVYEYALNQNLEALRQLQAEGHCLTQYHHAFHSEFNAIAKLAFDGHGITAEWLVDHNIGHVNDLLSGYAHAGNTERARYWLKEGGSVSLCMEGMAFAGNVKAVNQLLAANHHTRSLHFSALLGYAKGGHELLVDTHINIYFPATHHYHLIAISQAVVGYAKRGDERGLALAEHHKINLANYYDNLNINTAIESIPEDYRINRIYRTAFLGRDEDLLNTPLALTETHRKNITNNFYLGGHQPPKGFDIENHSEIIASLARNNHYTMIEPMLITAKDDMALQNVSTRGHYQETSGYVQASYRLSINEKPRTRELLHIKNAEKRKRLHTITGLAYNSDVAVLAGYLRKLKRVSDWSHATDSFECAWLLADKANRQNAINLVIVSLHQTAGVLYINHVVDVVLAHLLNTTGANAAKIHQCFAGIFKKCSSQNKPLENNDTLTQKPNGNH